MAWTDPPRTLRTATPEGDYSVAALWEATSIDEERAEIFKQKTLEDAQSLAMNVVESGGLCKIYNAVGDPV